MANEIVKQVLQGHLNDLLQEYAESLVAEGEDVLIPWYITEECWFYVEGVVEDWVENNINNPDTD
jgi:hypothetical protein